MAHTENWDASYESEPADSDSPSGGDDEFRDLKRNVRERMLYEHQWKDSTTTDGHHKEGSARTYYTNTAPTTRPDGSTALDSDDMGRVWFDINDTNALYHWTGTTWCGDVKIASNLEVTGSITFSNTITGPLHIASNVDITGTLTVGGVVDLNSNVQIAGTLSVAGATDLDGALSVAGTTDITSALHVTGSGTFDGGVDAGDNSTMLKWKGYTGTLDGDGNVEIAHGLGAVTIWGLLVSAYLATGTWTVPGSSGAGVEIFAQHDGTNIYLNCGTSSENENYRVMVFYS